MMTFRMRRLTTVFLVVFMVAVWATVGVVWTQRQEVSDWWRLRGYDPPAEIVKLADDTRMTDHARKLFYVYHPVVEPASDFNDHCRIENEFTIVLGCYVSNQGIYIFRVDDDRLDGIMEVTAAHEMLHVAYERYSSEERERLDALTAAAFKGITDERLRQTIEQYRHADPTSVPNELYSILGTEVRELPDELEQHYKAYFTDRMAVVSYAENYEKAFNDRKRAIDNLATTLQHQKDEIDRLTVELDRENQALAAGRAELERIRGTVPPEEFNAKADTYNDMVESYNRKVSDLSQKIDRYNAGIEQYEKLVLERQNLFNAIDSRPEKL